MAFKRSWGILKDSVHEFLEDKALRLAASTAYYAVFSIGPLLVLIVGLAGLVFGEETVRREVSQQVESFLGTKSANIVSSMMSAQHTGDSLIATIVGGVALLMGAAGIFGQLQDALNTIWGVTTKPGKGIWALVRDRFFSMAMVLGIGFLLLVSMALSAFVSAFAEYLGSLISMPPWVAVALNDVASFLVITVLFALIFKVLPDVRIQWRHVWAGAIGTAFLFTLGKLLLGLYLGRESSTSTYGTGAAFIIILLYIYYSSVILYFGAEFTQVWAHYQGAKVRPSKYAILMTPEQRANQGMPTSEQVEKAAGEGKNASHNPKTEAPATQEIEEAARKVEDAEEAARKKAA